MNELPSPVAFVLSGGSSLGATQVGMLRALHEAGVTPDLVVGTSVGAINGAMVAHDPAHAHERLALIWSGLRRHDIFPGGIASQARTLLMTRTHVFSPLNLARLIRTNLPVTRFDELRIRFGAVVTDAMTGHAVTLTDGPLAPAVLASAAIPGAFPAVVIDGHTYLDGGVASNVPIVQALELGPASLVVLDPGFPCHRTEPPGSIAETVLFSGAVLLRQHALCELPEAAARVPVVYLRAPCPQSVSPFDFSRSRELMDRAYAAASSFLGDLRVDGAGLYGRPHAHDH